MRIFRYIDVHFCTLMDRKEQKFIYRRTAWLWTVITTPQKTKKSDTIANVPSGRYAEIAQPTNEIVARLAFGNTLMSHVYIGTDEAMSGIQYFGIVTIWHDHPVYGTHAQAGIITYHPDTCEWYKDTREIFSACDYTGVNPVFTCIKHARARMYEMVAHELKAYAWNVESRRD